VAPALKLRDADLDAPTSQSRDQPSVGVGDCAGGDRRTLELHVDFPGSVQGVCYNPPIAQRTVTWRVPVAIRSAIYAESVRANTTPSTVVTRILRAAMPAYRARWRERANQGSASERP